MQKMIWTNSYLTRIMSSQVDSEFDFKTREEENEYLKTRIESIGLSIRTQNALAKASIRTIGGIARKTESSLHEIDGLGVAGIEEIKKVLKDLFGFSVSSTKSREEYQKSLPGLDLTTQKVEIQIFLKKPIETLGFSVRTYNALTNGGVRTVGGLVRKKIVSLLALKGLGAKCIEEIKKELERIFNISGDQKTETIINIQENPDSFQENPTNLFPDLFSHDKDDIIAAFAKHFGVEKKVIESMTRQKEIVKIRDLISYSLRKYAHMSFPAIGRLLGGRDHTTIIHSYKKVSKSLNSEVDFESKFSELIAKVKSIQERKSYIKQTIIPNLIASIGSQITSRKTPHWHKEISGRDVKVLDLYREGLTLENIGKVIKVSRERVRQIVEKTIRQMASNDSIAREITIDANVLVEEEKKKRNILQRRIEDTTFRQDKEKRWSTYYIACKSCGTTTIPHLKKGLCEQCIGHFRDDRREEIVRQHENKCDSCGLLRHEASASYGRDFYITKDKRVYCRKCFLETTGKKLGGYKNYTWSRFFSECKSCGTTSIPHFRTGLCEKCGNKITDKEREVLCSSGCNSCGLDRTEAKNKFGRDLYMTKDGKIYCMKCFHIRAFRRYSKVSH